VAVHRSRAARRANAIVASIHPKAAPVILTTDEERRRLDARAGSDLGRPVSLKAVPVHKQIPTVTADVEPVGPNVGPVPEDIPPIRAKVRPIATDVGAIPHDVGGIAEPQIATQIGLVASQIETIAAHIPPVPEEIATVASDVKAIRSQVPTIDANVASAPTLREMRKAAPLASTPAGEMRASAHPAKVHPSSSHGMHPPSHAAATAAAEGRRCKSKRRGERAHDEIFKEPVVHPILLCCMAATDPVACKEQQSGGQDRPTTSN